jgi:hypothetical protein
LSIDSAQVAQNAQRMDATKPICSDLVHALASLEPPPTLRDGDLVHVSVMQRAPRQQ